MEYVRVRRNFFLLVTLSLVLCSVSLAIEGEVEAVTNVVDDYEEKLQNEFSQYKKTYDEALDAFRQKILKKWGEYKTGDRHVWISYTNNNSVRRTVDFQNGTITIEKISSASRLSKQSQKEFMLELPNLLLETETQAFRSDEVATRVEDVVSQNSELVQQGKNSNRRVLYSLIANLQSADIRAIGALSNQLSEGVDVKTHKALVPGKTIHVVSYALPNRIPDKSRIFADAIVKAAQKEEIPIALIHAVIETESHFNLLARTDAPAFGLMQIAPLNAGKDAARYLFGKPKILAPSYLYNGDNNIAVGSAYLHTLYYEQFSSIENPVSRLYCTVAAFRSGVGDVALTFDSAANMSSAAVVINRSSPQQVLETLTSQLPVEETRAYVSTVIKMMDKYQADL